MSFSSSSIRIIGRVPQSIPVLSDISFIPTAGKGAYVSDAMEVQKDNDIAVYEFCFDEYSEQVEFVIINEGSGEVRLDSVDLAITAR